MFRDYAVRFIFAEDQPKITFKALALRKARGILDALERADNGGQKNGRVVTVNERGLLERWLQKAVTVSSTVKLFAGG